MFVHIDIKSEGGKYMEETMKYCMKLALLNQLRSKNLITEDEYDRIKAYIMKRHLPKKFKLEI